MQPQTIPTPQDSCPMAKNPGASLAMSGRSGFNIPVSRSILRDAPMSRPVNLFRQRFATFSDHMLPNSDFVISIPGTGLGLQPHAAILRHLSQKRRDGIKLFVPHNLVVPSRTISPSEQSSVDLTFCSRLSDSTRSFWPSINT